MVTREKQKIFSELIAQDKPVLVDFFAEWCGPCKMMNPVLEELKSRIGDKAIIIKVDVGRNPLVAGIYHIQGLPGLMLFKKKEVRWRQSGVVPAAYLEKVIIKNI